MKRECGWYLPDGEEHLQAWMRRMKQAVPGGRLGYQQHKYQTALKWVKARRVAVDVGAHVGLWSWPMAHDFGRVVAFEPMPAHRDCWFANMEDLPSRGRAILEACALGDRAGEVKMRTRTAGSSGDTGVELDGDGVAAPLRTLDSFGLVDVDFVKIDCEGYEVFVCAGAEETLRRCRPCVIVEQKPETGGARRYGVGVTDAVAFLECLGARRRAGIQGDYILSWD